MVSISKYLNENLIAFLNVESRDEALIAMIDMLEREGKLQDRRSFYDAIMDREKIVSTGIGMGVAIPHAKLPSYDDFFIGIGILQKGVEWNSLDQSPVRLIFMIGGPDDKQTEYLQLLSSLTLAIKDEERRKLLLNVQSQSAIANLFKIF